jgi:uncharacterized membrane protein YjjB (DUF3815 family)
MLLKQPGVSTTQNGAETELEERFVFVVPALFPALPSSLLSLASVALNLCPLSHSSSTNTD